MIDPLHALHPWPGMALVLAILLSAISGLKIYARCCNPHPELVRKLLHISMGLVTLSFPWLFDKVWPVLLLAVVASLQMVGLRYLQPLRLRLGGVVDGVGRDSWGELYFPLAIAAVWVLSGGQPLLFCVPILILALADAVGALIGVHYGRRLYGVADEQKSVEGSLAFFIVAFFSVHVPLLLFSNTGRVEALLIALTLGLLVMLLEAIAWRGLDNLFIPVGSFILLRNFLKLDAAALAIQFGVALALVIFGLWLRRRTTLDESAMMGAALVGYASWALGGWRWLMPPLLLFAVCALLSPRDERNSRGVGIHAVVCVASTSLLWLFLYSSLDRPEYFYPYILAFAAHLAILGIARLKHDFPHLPIASVLTISVLTSWLLLFIPFLVIERFTVAAWTCFSMASIGITLAALAFSMTQPQLHNCPVDGPRWLRQGAIAAAVSMLALVALPLV